METILTQDEAAQRLRVMTRTLERMRVRGDGPAFIRIGARRVGYLEGEIERWLAQRTARSRAEELARAVAAE